MSGSGGDELDDVFDEHGEPGPRFTEYFEAKHFYPPLPLFVPPEGCRPEAVTLQLSNVSSLLTAHPTTAANAIRSLLEVLLDDLSVPRMVLTKTPKPYFLTLHARIDNYPQLLSIHRGAFMALKHFGNAGSHGGRLIEQNHRKDACEVLELIVTQLYHGLRDISGHIARLAKVFAIN